MNHKIKLQLWRRTKNIIATTLSLLAMALGISCLLWILYTVCHLGIHALSWQLLTQMTPPPNASGGGLANAIAGSALLVVIATLLGTPLGILSGIYLVEYGKHALIAQIIRFINDILLSAPSIIIGLFVYALIVVNIGHFSGWAGIAALVLLQIPIVVHVTENMLNLTPNALREAAFALGTPKWKMITHITLKAATPGIVTGCLLAVARISGETAPLLFTSLSNQFWSLNLSQPIANLPVTIFKFAMSPFQEWQELAWAGVFLITVSVLSLNIIARLFFKKT